MLGHVHSDHKSRYHRSLVDAQARRALSLRALGKSAPIGGLPRVPAERATGFDVFHTIAFGHFKQPNDGREVLFGHQRVNPMGAALTRAARQVRHAQLRGGLRPPPPIAYLDLDHDVP